MPGQSLVNVENAAFLVLDAWYGGPAFRDVSAHTLSPLSATDDPVARAIFGLALGDAEAFDNAKRKEAFLSLIAINLDPGPSTNLSALYEEVQRLLNPECKSPIDETRQQLNESVKRRDLAKANGDFAGILEECHYLQGLLEGDQAAPIIESMIANQLGAAEVHLREVHDSYALHSTELLWQIAQQLPSGNIRNALTTNFLYLSTEAYERTQEVQDLRRTMDAISPTELDLNNWQTRVAFMHAHMCLYKANPILYTDSLTQALAAAEKGTGADDSSMDLPTLSTLSEVYSDVGRALTDPRYVRMSVETSREAASRARSASDLTYAHALVNLANALLQLIETDDADSGEKRALSEEALALAEQGAEIARSAGCSPRAMAVDQECLARAYTHWANQEQDVEKRLRHLTAARQAAIVAVETAQDGSGPSQRHGETLLMALYGMAVEDPDGYHEEFAACADVLMENNSSAAHWLSGRFKLKQSDPESEMVGLQLILRSAELHPSPAIKFARCDEAAHEMVERLDRFQEPRYQEECMKVFRGLLLNSRSVWWSPRGVSSTRDAVRRVAWMAPILAEWALLNDDVGGALEMLGLLANGLWEMNVASSRGRHDLELGLDPHATDRTVFERGLSVNVPEYDGGDRGPVLAIVFPGATCGWLILRAVGAPDRFFRLPGLDVKSVHDLAGSWRTLLDDAGLRRGVVTGIPALQGDLGVIGETLCANAGEPDGNWVVWCPMGELVGLPLHATLPQPGAWRHSYSTTPLFTPGQLEQHSASAAGEFSFFGWGQYPLLDNLPGV